MPSRDALPDRRSPRARATRLAGAILLGLPLIAGASGDAAPVDLTELPIERLVDLEVDAASRFAQRAVEAPSAVRVITAAEIRDQHWRTLAEALSSLPGLYTSYDRSYAYLGARGFLHPGDYNSRFLLLIDGNRINDPAYDQAPMGADFPLDLDLVERIEYVPGPASSAYGSNAFLGVINVVTRDAGDFPDTTATVALGSWGRREVGVRRGWQRGDGRLLLAATATAVDGDDLYYPELVTDDFDGVARGIDGERTRRVYLGGGQGAFHFSLVHGDRDKDDPTASFHQRIGDRRGANRDTRTLADVGWRDALSPTLEASAHVFGGEYRYAGAFAYAAPPTLNHDQAHADWMGAGAQLLSTAFARHKLVAGIDLQVNSRREIRNFDTDPDVETLRLHDHGRRIGVFVNDEFTLMPGLLLNAGARFDHDEAGSRTSPRVALIANPTARTTLKAIFGEAYRSPNLFESEYYIGPPMDWPDVRPETIATRELAWTQRLDDRFGVSVSLFDYRLQGLIGQRIDPESDRLYYANLDDFRSRGGEVGVDYAGDDGVRVRASVGRTDTHTDAREGPVENAPRVLFNVNATLPIPGTPLRLGIDARQVGARHGAQGRVPSYRTVNVAATWQRDPSGLELSATLYNAFDADYADPVSDTYYQAAIPQDGRSFLVRATWRF